MQDVVFRVYVFREENERIYMQLVAYAQLRNEEKSYAGNHSEITKPSIWAVTKREVLALLHLMELVL